MVSCKKLVIFYSIITFSYTKHFVHSYTVDVVYTLSYCIIPPHSHLYSRVKYYSKNILGKETPESDLIATLRYITCLYPLKAQT